MAQSPAAAVATAAVVITMLSDGPAVSEVLFERGVAEAIHRNALVIDMSSIPPALARSHARRLAMRGILHLDAPVSGGTSGAADGALAIMVGGRRRAYQIGRPILELIGNPTLVGRSGSGQLAKLANQVIVAATIGAIAEALILAAAGGAEPAQVRKALAGGFADSAILRRHGERMLRREWTPGGSIRSQVKDLRTVLAVAQELDIELPVTRRVSELFECALNSGWEDYDHSALILELERRNPPIRLTDKLDRHC